MFDVGFSELVVVALVALLVLGPKRLPEVARTAGRWMGQFRRFADGVRQDFQSEINTAEFNELRNIKEDLNQAREVFEGSLAPAGRPSDTTAGTASESATSDVPAPQLPSPAPTTAPAVAEVPSPTPDTMPPAAVKDGRKRS